MIHRTDVNAQGHDSQPDFRVKPRSYSSLNECGFQTGASWNSTTFLIKNKGFEAGMLQPFYLRLQTYLRGQGGLFDSELL